jgi:hypothetical protein
MPVRYLEFIFSHCKCSLAQGDSLNKFSPPLSSLNYSYTVSLVQSSTQFTMWWNLLIFLAFVTQAFEEEVADLSKFYLILCNISRKVI